MITRARVQRAGWIVMTMAATGVALASARYFSLDPAVFIPRQVATYMANLAPLLIHVGGGTLALSIGPWQLWTGLRARHPALHRLLGRLYVAAVALIGAGGVVLAPLSLGGLGAHLGFTGMGAAVLLTTGMAFVAIRRRRIPAHRAWMIRSYAVVFSAVTFRAWLGVLQVTHHPIAGPGYAVGAWGSWMIDLLVAELLIRLPALVRRLGQGRRVAVATR